MNIQTSHQLEITIDNCEGERVWRVFWRSIFKKYFEKTILFCVWNTFWKVFYFVISKILSKSISFGTIKILWEHILRNAVVFGSTTSVMQTWSWILVLPVGPTTTNFGRLTSKLSCFLQLSPGEKRLRGRSLQYL